MYTLWLCGAFYTNAAGPVLMIINVTITVYDASSTNAYSYSIQSAHEGAAALHAVLSASVLSEEVLLMGLPYSSSTALLKLYWFSISSESQTCEAGKHHIIFLLYYFCCSWQILLSSSRDRCFCVFPFLSNDEKTEFFWQPLLSTFFTTVLICSLRCASIHVY